MEINYTRDPSYDECPICHVPMQGAGCWQRLKGTHSVAHSEDGTLLLHHLHLKCIRIWAEINPECPTCRCEINIDSVRSFQYRMWIKLNQGIKEQLVKIWLLYRLALCEMGWSERPILEYLLDEKEE